MVVVIAKSDVGYEPVYESGTRVIMLKVSTKDDELPVGYIYDRATGVRYDDKLIGTLVRNGGWRLVEGTIS